MIAIFIGIGLVSKEIEKRTLYTVLSRPVRRWEFIVGKFFGLAGTLVVNTFFMAIGVFAALFYVSHKFVRADALILVALYFIILEFLIICSLALVVLVVLFASAFGRVRVLLVCDWQLRRRSARIRRHGAWIHALAGDGCGLSGAKSFCI